MGTWHQSIVDIDVRNPDEAQQAAARVLAWLVGEQIVEPGLTHCVLGADDLGHRPGPQSGKALDGVHPGWAEDAGLNGLEIVTARTVACNHQGEFLFAVCPACAAQREQDGPWSAACAAWLDGGPGLLACDACGAASAMPEWDHVDPMAFGALTLCFWDWPPLSASFVVKVGQVLGHRTRTIVGKL